MHELIQEKGTDWTERNLLIPREPRNLEEEFLVNALVNGASPHLAAKEFCASNNFERRLESARWLAYETEEQLFETLGDGLDGYIEALIKVGSVEILPSRVRRLIQKAASRGLKTRSATMVELKI